MCAYGVVNSMDVGGRKLGRLLAIMGRINCVRRVVYHVWG